MKALRVKIQFVDVSMPRIIFHAQCTIFFCQFSNKYDTCAETCTGRGGEFLTG